MPKKSKNQSINEEPIQQEQNTNQNNEQQESSESKVINEKINKAKDSIKEVLTTIDENIEEPDEDQDKKELDETLDYHKIRLATYKLETLNKIIEQKGNYYSKIIEKLDPSKPEDYEKIQEIMKEFNEYYKILFHYTDNLVFNRQILEEQVEKKNFTIKDNHEKYKVQDVSPQVHIDEMEIDRSKLSKEDIKTLILADEGDLKKVFLLNSGFNIVIRDSELLELNTLFNKLQEETNEYGRMFGALFYLFSDIVIKEQLTDFIEKLIVKSNLKNWNKGNTFRKSLSIHDYDVILHSIASLMYPEGYIYKFNCPNPDCNYSEEVTIDLNRMKFFNFDIIPEKCLGMVVSNEPISYKNWVDYQKQLNFTDKVKIKKYVFHLKVPTMYEYLSYGKEFNKIMFETITEPNRDNITNYLQYNYLKIFAPWIEKVDVINTKTNEVKLTITDRDIILTILDIIQKAGDPLSDKIIDFIKNTKITHICYPVNPCPECKQIPDNAVNGFIPFDIQNNFFSQCLMRLIQTLSEKNQ